MKTFWYRHKGMQLGMVPSWIFLPLSREGVVSEVEISGFLGDYEVYKFKIFGDGRKTAIRTTAPDMGRADFKLLIL